MLTRPVAMLCRVRSGEKARNVVGWLAALTTLYERESTPIKLVWGAEEAMLGSLNYIPPVLRHVHTMAWTSLIRFFCFHFFDKICVSRCTFAMGWW